MKKFFSIIIPYYSNINILQNYLNSIQKSSLRNFEIIIVNDSLINIDRHLKDFDVKIVNNKKNLGYARSLNEGSKIATGEFLILSNSDILFKDNELLNLKEIVEKNKNFNVFQPALFNLNNRFDIFSKRYLPKRLSFIFFSFKLEKFNLFFRYFYSSLRSEEIECGKGAFLIVKKDIFNSVGKFSEEYWMFWEDVDFFHKLKIHGIKTLFIPQKILHLEGKTVEKMRLKANIGELQSRAIYFKKFHNIPPKLVFLFEILGASSSLIFHSLLLNFKMFKYYVKYLKYVLKEFIR